MNNVANVIFVYEVLWKINVTWEFDIDFKKRNDIYISYEDTEQIVWLVVFKSNRAMCDL